MNADDHYVVITADSHAGGSHQQYREFLDPKYRDDVRRVAGKYKNPFKDLKDTDLRVRNWDGELRDSQQNADGVVGEVDLPEHGAAVLPELRAVRAAADAGGVRAPPRRHPGAQPLAGRLTSPQKPEARAGIGQIFLNDLDDAIADVQWCKENGLRGGVLVGSPPTTCDWLKPLYDPHYDPLWAACEELGVPVNAHSGTGGPVYQRAPAMPIVHVAEMVFYSQRPLVYLIVGGVFERFPNLKFVLTEAGCAWVPAMLEQLDFADGLAAHRRYRRDAIRGRDRAAALGATEYFKQNCYVGDEPAATGRHRGRARSGRHRPGDVGKRLPARGGHAAVHAGAPAPGDGPPPARADPADRRRATRPTLYGFDLDALRPAADRFGPTVAEIAEPLTDLPDHPNEALRRSAGELAEARSKAALLTPCGQVRSRVSPRPRVHHPSPR